MNSKENNELKKIAKHVCILNKELGEVKINVGKLQVHMMWIKRILFSIAGMVFIGVGKILFFG